jgi:hypothetical protein
MRFDSNYVRLHIINQLHRTPFAKIRYDDFDVTVVDLPQGQAAAICLMERAPTSLAELLDVYREHNSAKTHIVFILWCEMLLPEHGDIFEPSEWLHALHSLHNKKIYAFKNLADKVDIFPVQLERIGFGPERLVKHGQPIDIRDLNCAAIDISGGRLEGRWLMADFVAGSARRNAQRVYKARADDAETQRQRWYHYQQRQQYQQQSTPQPASPYDAVLPYFRALGLPVGVEWEDVKQAYRALARQYHPDLNPSKEAHQRMQHINAAYAHLIAFYGERAK